MYQLKVRDRQPQTHQRQRPFSHKRIATYTLGERLRRNRISLRLSLADISQRTKIKIPYLEALENGEYWKLPAETYIRIFLRSYACVLQLSPSKILEMYEKEARLYKKRFASQQHKTLLRTRRLRSIVVPRLAKTMMSAVFVLAVFVYISWELSQTLTPPSLQIFTPFDNVITQEYSVNISGKTDPESQVLINGQSVTVKPSGEFEEKIPLHDGLNTIEISAQKGSVRKSTLYKQVVVEPSS